jgi:3-oxoacyl-[acyl-carrier protein] reductase
MKTVLVTGASRGLGLAICRRLLQDGLRVIGLSRIETEDFRSLAKDPGAKDRVTFFEFDLARVDEIPDVVASLKKSHGKIYGLVNNAAVGLDGLLATQHATDISKILAVNLQAPIVLTKYTCRSMIAEGEGRIVNVSSIVARTGFSGLSVYAATKAGLEGFTRSLARELGRANVTVNCVAPGFMETEMTSGLKEQHLDSIRRRSPLGLPGVNDAAGAVSYLLGPDSARVTGSVITVDGGSTA